MIVVDASAILAILFDEPEGPGFRDHLVAAGAVISPVNHWEVLVTAHVRLGAEGVAAAERLMAVLMVDVAPISGEHSRLAAEASRRFGKSSAARLNLGDCFAYALAKVEGEGLLFKGDDFPKTDVKPALP